MVGCGCFSFLEKGVFDAIGMLEVDQQVVNLIFNKYLLSMKDVAKYCDVVFCCLLYVILLCKNLD